MPTLQLALPIALILWLAVLPLPGHARIAHAAMTIALVLTIILFFAWLRPSAYAPIGVLILLVLALLFGRRRPADRRNPRILPGLLAASTALVASMAAAGLVTARLRPAAMLDLAMPFAAATAITEGGARDIINRHRAVLDPASPRLSGWLGTAHAVTLHPVDALGRPLVAPQPVLAPCAGAVLAQGTDTRLGDYVMLACNGAQVVMSGLMTTRATGPVTLGQPIGTATTLTLHAQTPGTTAYPFSGTPEWISLNGTYPVRGWVLRP